MLSNAVSDVDWANHDYSVASALADEVICKQRRGGGHHSGKEEVQGQIPADNI